MNVGTTFEGTSAAKNRASGGERGSFEGLRRAADGERSDAMPRRKQTQPMQRKYSEDSKERDERLSETDLDDLLEGQGVTADFDGVEGGSDCNDTFNGYQNLCCSADDPEGADNLKGTAFYASNLEAAEKHMRVADGSVYSGSEHHQSAVKGDAYLAPESHGRSPTCPGKRNEYSEGFSDDDDHRLSRTSVGMEVETEKENDRFNSQETNMELTEKSLKREYHYSTNDVQMKNKKKKKREKRLSFGGVGCESGGDRSSSCPVLSSSGMFYGKDPAGSRTTDSVERSLVLASDNSSRQSSVKQLESFVASVDCHDSSGVRSTSTTNPERKGGGVQGGAALSSPGIVHQMPAGVVAAQPRKSKGSSSRFKSHVTALPKLAKQQQQQHHQQQQQQHHQQQGSTAFLERFAMTASTQHCGDPNQPLDLSVKPRPRHAASAKYLSYSGSHDFSSGSSSSFSSASAAVGGGTSSSSSLGMGSSLADLEKKFGNTSAIFDRIGTKTWASPFCGALVSRLGMNLYNSKLHASATAAVFGDAGVAMGGPPGSAFGLGMIPVPVQRFNSSATAQAPPVKSDVPAVVKSGHTADDTDHQPSGGPRSSTGLETGFQWHAQKHTPAVSTADASTDSHRKHTNFLCSCGAELETLYHLTMHLQQTGHAPNRSKNAGRQEYSKLVRGQDMWLNHGCEQTRQILRCMECDESFKSLPELTVHMIKTKHYANIVGSDSLQQKKAVTPPSPRVGETRSDPSTEEEDEEEEDDDDEANSRVHCLVCLEAFKNPETLGVHIVEMGHYKDTTTGSERLGGTAAESSSSSSPPVKDSLGGQSARRGLPSSRADVGLVPVGLSSPLQPGAAKDSADSVDTLPYVAENTDRKRSCSVSEGSVTDEFKEEETAATREKTPPRRSDCEEIPTKYKRMDGKSDRLSIVEEANSPHSSLAAKDRHRRRSQAEDTSPSGETNLNAPYFPQQRNKDANHFSGRQGGGGEEREEEDEGEEMEEDQVESNVDSSVFQVENFFRPSSSSNSSSDGSAIRAMETFIKKSFGSASDTKQRLPAAVRHPKDAATSRLVGSPMTQFGCYDPLGRPAAGQQELQAIETSRSLYQNKYLPPAYVTSPPRDDRRPGGDEVLPGAPPPFLPATMRKIKTETGAERSPKRESFSESTNRESEVAAMKEAERPGSRGKTDQANRRREGSSHRQDVKTQSPEYHGKTDSDSVKDNGFASNVSVASNRTVDPQLSVETVKTELSETESDERLSSTSNNNNSNNSLFNRSSALESLQGLVYGKSLNTEHPLDSLQKLIYGRGGNTAGAAASARQVGASGHPLNGTNSSHAATVIVRGSDSLHYSHPHSHPHSLPSGTLILVNPIVTVVPGASGSNPSLNITLPGSGDPSAAAARVADNRSGCRRNRSPAADSDDRENSLRVYRCRGCRRKFSSKGSYRYHLSRCHVLTSSSSSSTAMSTGEKGPPPGSSVKDPLRKNPYFCAPLDATAKFNKYYQLASELGTEAK